MPPILTRWNPEDADAWKDGQSQVAWRNLAISIPSLLTAFCVWMFWSVLTVRMKEVGFPFSAAQLFTLISIAGLSGSTLRIPSSFLVSVAGGRNTIAITTALLIIPSLGAGLALQDLHTSFATFAILAALSGIGGGNFASSMANVPPFFPKRLSGTALGLNGGLGNLGVSVMQFFTPLVMGAAMCGSLAGAPHLNAAGRALYVQNGALIWVPVAALLAVLAWFFMDNLPGQDADPVLPAILRILGLHGLGFVATALSVVALVSWKTGLLGQLAILAGTVLVALGLLKLLRGGVKARLDVQFKIFGNRHTWLLSLLYLGTFGSFIGFSGALPLLIKVVFGHYPVGTLNPHSPNPLAYAWLGPFVGSLFRPVGGWIADRWKGAHLAQISLGVMILASLGVAHFVKLAQAAPNPEIYFTPFLGLFLVVFVATGLGNGAVFQMAPALVGPSLAGPTLGWMSAMAAYGSFLIPAIFKNSVDAGAAQEAMYGFAAFYVVCLGLNTWFYLRRTPVT